MFQRFSREKLRRVPRRVPERLQHPRRNEDWDFMGFEAHEPRRLSCIQSRRRELPTQEFGLIQVIHTPFGGINFAGIKRTPFAPITNVWRYSDGRISQPDRAVVWLRHRSITNVTALPIPAIRLQSLGNGNCRRALPREL